MESAIKENHSGVCFRREARTYGGNWGIIGRAAATGTILMLQPPPRSALGVPAVSMACVREVLAWLGVAVKGLLPERASGRAGEAGLQGAFHPCPMDVARVSEQLHE
ncbi:hypothetical protein E2C01_021893 [Portunus trituberculatus]|uniref:Uncharacterized protein n=1 Tax=Portunus trituberculatus TaxID=210409 RepID=A0A5B7E670_PORTR|nr:hypothetical protein [Portunus trituberculatus]